MDEITRQADEIEMLCAERRDHIAAMKRSKKIHYAPEIIALAEVRLDILRRAARTMRAIANNAEAVRAALKKGVNHG